MRFELIEDWRRVLKRAWSIRLILLAGLLSGAEVLIPIFTDDPPLPRGVFGALSFFVTAGAFIARILAQKDEPNGDQ